jgi:hypothetical protein
MRRNPDVSESRGAAGQETVKKYSAGPSSKTKYGLLAIEYVFACQNSRCEPCFSHRKNWNFEKRKIQPRAKLLQRLQIDLNLLNTCTTQ